MARHVPQQPRASRPRPGQPRGRPVGHRRPRRADHPRARADVGAHDQRLADGPGRRRPASRPCSCCARPATSPGCSASGLGRRCSPVSRPAPTRRSTSAPSSPSASPSRPWSASAWRPCWSPPSSASATGGCRPAAASGVLLLALTGLVLVSSTAGLGETGPRPLLGVRPGRRSAASTYAVTTMLAERIAATTTPLALTTVATGAGAVALLPLGLLGGTRRRTRWSPPTRSPC